MFVSWCAVVDSAEGWGHSTALSGWQPWATIKVCTNTTPIKQQSGTRCVVSNFTIGTCSLGNIEVTLDLLTPPVSPLSPLSLPSPSPLPPPLLPSIRAGKSGGVSSAARKTASASSTTTRSPATLTWMCLLGYSSWKSVARYSLFQAIPSPDVCLPSTSPTERSTYTPRKSE